MARRVGEVVGSRAGLPNGALEELQVAVSEVCNRLVTAAVGATEEGLALQVRFSIEPDRVIAEVGGTGDALSRTVADLLDEQFLRSLMSRLVDRALRGGTPCAPTLRMEELRPQARAVTRLDKDSNVRV